MQTYAEAFNEAVEMANRLNMDVGLMRNAFGGWSTFLLPRPENRRGSELRCQVVMPGTPRTNIKFTE
jgi:hypothetical protein